ncbi:uncharacterized protein LOC117640739 isoform X2 [Thrips palmi]|nr:uncharacterized protein LOC117640739 isoform X2 [Thrips palmi]XP_034233483.1 uncharacterized protein LOC117640739 isoform X2 [Thrips palmi]XP_034233484.1 uncharacterized protein LOC117640739 isoform X2 [Thrips palmi]XP_034233485.1 uncharacterized protein LOC117640739 isoform X2 [Thrips palmi]XP_034233486.1 uncharacterized protein LOC117640739 isoform X2 [Thrips palmi]XP_034233488.1 uncharacterized protein LOC117640739 isoform X2 [Thrips palmi]XP_034233489.1 uncharacterized protein LOC11764
MAAAPSDREAVVNGSSEEECERCVVCLARAEASSGGLSCSRCQDEFYCGVEHRDEHRAVHKKVCFQPRGLKVVNGKAVCSVCGGKGLLCARCGLAAYCSKEHQKEDWPLHKKSCKKPSVDTANINPKKEDDEQALGLATLPKELLLTVCALLGPYDLVRLGQVNRALRVVARDPAAWQHVTFPERKPTADAAVERAGHSTMAMLDRSDAITRALGRDAGYGVLRVAPALGTLRIIHSWPPVNLLRYTHRVRVLELEWMEVAGPYGYGADKLRRVLEHYRGHLQVLQLPRIDDVATLHFIDGLGLRELRLGGAVVRTYDAAGSAKGVDYLLVGSNVTGEVVLELLRPCEDTVTIFQVQSRLLDFCRWAFLEPETGVVPALRRCALLRTVEVPARWLVRGLLNDFTDLTALHLIDLGTEKHAEVRRALAAFPLARNINTLSVTLAFQAHRGLVEMVADSFPLLTCLWLAFDSTSDQPTMDHMSNRAPDVPRDLAAMLDLRLIHLEVLWLTDVRVPSTVLDGLAAGLLPKLRRLQLQNIQLTRLGRAALVALRGARPALRVQKLGVRLARRKLRWGGLEDEEPQRCEDPACLAPSDCEDEDPVPTDDESDDTSGDDSDW